MTLKMRHAREGDQPHPVPLQALTDGLDQNAQAGQTRRSGLRSRAAIERLVSTATSTSSLLRTTVASGVASPSKMPGAKLRTANTNVGG